MRLHSDADLVGDSLTVELRTLTPLVLVRIQVPQPNQIKHLAREQTGTLLRFYTRFYSFRSPFLLLKLSHRSLGQLQSAP
jgi:hypothetical protein